MHRMPLTGIPGSNPIGAMAAFGLFRICHCESPFGGCRLSWKLDSDWRPMLHFEEQCTGDELTQFLIHRQQTRTCHAALLWSDDIKSPPEEFRDQVRGCELPEVRDFFAAFGSEVVTAKSTPDVKPTAFHMTAGQQKFLKSGRNLSASLDLTQNPSRRDSDADWQAKLSEAWTETLFGPWMYADDEHSLGWDPTTEGLYALSDRSPSAAGPTSVRGAVWLAFESLPLFPCVPTFTGNAQSSLVLHTTGFDAGSEHFSWPVWETPISFEALECLITSPSLSGDVSGMKELIDRGCAAVFRSRCLRDGNGRGTFRNARQLI